MLPAKQFTAESDSSPKPDDAVKAAVLVELRCGLCETVVEVLTAEAAPHAPCPTCGFICQAPPAPEPDEEDLSPLTPADPLTRWLAGEPIKPTPVGDLREFSRLCRRHPLLSGIGLAATAIVALAALLLTAVLVDARDELVDRQATELRREIAGRDQRRQLENLVRKADREREQAEQRRAAMEMAIHVEREKYLSLLESVETSDSAAQPLQPEPAELPTEPEPVVEEAPQQVPASRDSRNIFRQGGLRNSESTFNAAWSRTQADAQPEPQPEPSTPVSWKYAIDEEGEASLGRFFPEWDERPKATVTLRQLMHGHSAASRQTVDFIDHANAVSLPTLDAIESDEAIQMLAGVVQKAAGKPLDPSMLSGLLADARFVDFRWTREDSSDPQVMAGFLMLPGDVVYPSPAMLDGEHRGKHVSLVKQPASDEVVRRDSQGNAVCGVLWWKDQAISAANSDADN